MTFEKMEKLAPLVQEIALAIVEENRGIPIAYDFVKGNRTVRITVETWYNNFVETDAPPQ